MTYQPKFPPEVYLRFLNSCDHFKFYNNPPLFYNCTFYWADTQRSSRYLDFSGSSVEQCIDQAIIETGFDKTIDISASTEEEKLIAKLYRYLTTALIDCKPGTLAYLKMVGIFTESERSLLNKLIKNDFEKAFKEAGFDESL